MVFISLNRLVCAIVSIIFIGYPFAYLLLIKSTRTASNLEAYVRFRMQYGRILLIILSFFIGSAVSSMYLTVLSLFNIDFTLVNIIIFSAAFLVYSVVLIAVYNYRLNKTAKFSGTEIENVVTLRIRRTKDYKNNSYSQLSLGRKTLLARFSSFKTSLATEQGLKLIFGLLIFINLLIVLFFTFLFPIRFWDAVSSYSLKAKAFFIDSNMITFYSSHDYLFSHQSYPPLLSLMQTWIYIWLGRVDENLVKIIFPIFYLSSVYLVFNFFARKASQSISIILAFIFSSLPIIMDHGYIEYNNLLFSIILFAGVYFFSIYISDELSQINAYTIRKKKMIEKAKLFIDEKKNENAFDFDVFENLDEVFKGSFVKASGSTVKADAGLLNIYESNADHLGSDETYRKFPNLYLSAVFFGILSLVRSEALFYCALFALVLIIIYTYWAVKKSLLKSKLKRIVIDFESVLSRKRPIQWWKNLDAKLVRNGDSPVYFINMFLKKLFLPFILLSVFYVPWYLTKLKLGLGFASKEWQEAFTQGNGSPHLLEGLRRAAGSFFFEFFYSSYDSTKAFLSSSYGPILILLLILLIAGIGKASKNGGLVFLIFTIFSLAAVFTSIVFVRDFTGSIERYIMPSFVLAYYWILSNTFKQKNLVSLKPEKL